MAIETSGGKRITIRELARMAQTSPGTVSRALSGNPKISDGVIKKITQLAQKHGYVPNQQARNLQKGTTAFLGFLASDLKNFTYINIFRQLESQCRKRGFSLLIADSEQRPELEREHIEYFLRLNVRGMFVCPVSDWKAHLSNEPLDVLLRNRIPTVAIGHISRPGLSTVVSEEENSAKQLIAELQILGHKRFLLIAYDVSGNIPAKIRINSMSKAILAIPGGAITDVIKSSKETSEWTNLVVAAVLKKKNRPTAIITVDEYQALALYEPLAEAGIRIPEDISLAAFGSSSHWIRNLFPALAANHINEEALVDAAMELLIKKMDSPSEPDRFLAIPQQFHLRKSVAKARV